MAELEPTPEQLSSPRGTPLTALNWADVRTRVSEADDFLLATTDPDGRPHVVPVLGVWLEGSVCFVTFREARKARNLARNNGCAVTVPGHDVDLVLEGAAHSRSEPSPTAEHREPVPAQVSVVASVRHRWRALRSGRHRTQRSSARLRG